MIDDRVSNALPLARRLSKNLETARNDIGALSDDDVGAQAGHSPVEAVDELSVPDRPDDNLDVTVLVFWNGQHIHVGVVSAALVLSVTHHKCVLRIERKENQRSSK